jgi:hypothetical protein
MRRICSGIWVVCLLLPTVAAAKELVLVEDGQAGCRILVREDAGEWERRAAEDLAKYMEMMSGVGVPLVDDAGEIEDALRGDEPLVLVGGLALEVNPEMAAELEGLRKQKAVLRADGIVAKREGMRVYLAGLNDECHYYAVVELLEIWGCRWFLPTDFGECIPEREKLSIDELDVRYAPPFEVRKYWLSWYGAQDGRREFMRRNRMNELSVPAGHALKGYVEELVPTGGTAFNVCLGSEETAEHVARQVLERFAEGDVAVSLGMDDGLYESDCEEDAALHGGIWDKYYLVPSLTDAFLTFYNNVARRTKVRFPDRRIGFLAYANITLPPQREMVAEEPLVAYLAPIDTCPIHGMDDEGCAARQEYRDVMYRWAGVMQGRLIIYDYDQGMLVWRDLPNPSVQSLRQDIRHYRDAGILGVDTECRGAMATVFLNLYLRGRLYWNPDADVEGLLEDFYVKFYGPAAAPMRRYWEGLLSAWEESDVHDHEFMLAPAIYAPELVETMGEAVAEGERLVEGLPEDDLFVQRMRFMRMGLGVLEEYMEMVRLAGSEVEYAAAVAAGERGLEWRRQLSETNPTFTTTRLEKGYPWWTGEVQQYRELAEVVDGTRGRLVGRLPLEWKFRVDPYDRGIVHYWAGREYDASGWRELSSDLYMEAQGVKNGDGSDYNGYVWYRTEIELAEEVMQELHLLFPGLFGEAWLYVDGHLVAHREWRPLWWHNDYRFEWDVDLGEMLEPGSHTLAVRLFNAHAMGGIWRRPFLYAPVEQGEEK